MPRDIDNYLRIKFGQLKNDYPNERAKLFESFYQNDFDNEFIIKMFSLFHSNINDLFEFLNSKNTPGFGGHYNADESRSLIDIFRKIENLRANTLDYEELKFQLNDYYADLIIRSKSFLQSSGGSPIPEDFEEINIIENKPIFTRVDVTRVENIASKSSVAIQQIGGGSYATVFEYLDPHYDTKFALKRAKSDLRDDELERFRLEFKDLKSFDSPFIIKAYSYNESENEYSMEYADQTLEKFYKYNNSSLTFTDRKMLIHQLLSAFRYIHSKNILHRDISYHNILIKKYDDRIMLKVSDFGLVKRPESNLTRVGTEVKGAINDYSDLHLVGFENYEIEHETYALSKIIYFMLTGRSSNYHKEKNEELKAFIMRGIGPKEQRYRSVEELWKILWENVLPSVQNQFQ